MVKKPTRVQSRELSQVEKLKSGQIALARALRASEIALARLEGYVTRVREEEACATTQEQPEPSIDGVEKLRRVLGHDDTAREADAIINVLSDDLLAKVLGKPDGLVEPWPGSAL